MRVEEKNHMVPNKQGKWVLNPFLIFDPPLSFIKKDNHITPQGSTHGEGGGLNFSAPS